MMCFSTDSNRAKFFGTGLGAVCGFVSLFVAALAMTTTVRAQPIVVSTINDPIGDSGFTLTFPGLGPISSSVVNTNIDIQIDEQAGTARFLKYSQLVEPLPLPGPNGQPINTGDIRIEIKSSDGTFDPATQTFTTNDVFEISFDGDLSGFGLTSPTLLPATSTGTVTGGPTSAQRIDMIWQGTGQLANPADPSQPLTFSYVSKNFTIIDPSPVAQAFNSLQNCGSGVCGVGSMGMMSLAFVGMGLLKLNTRRRRR